MIEPTAKTICHILELSVLCSMSWHIQPCNAKCTCNTWPTPTIRSDPNQTWTVRHIPTQIEQATLHNFEASQQLSSNIPNAIQGRHLFHSFHPLSRQWTNPKVMDRGHAHHRTWPNHMHFTLWLQHSLLVVTAAQSRSFAYVGTSSWNHLPLELRLELLRIHLPLLWKRLKIFSFVSDSTDLGWERLWISLKVALYKCTLTSQLILLLRNSFPEVITTGQTCKHTILNQVSYRKTTVSHP